MAVRRRRSIAVVVVVTAAALAVGAATRPAPSRLPDTAHGDADLAAQVRTVAGEDHRALAAAVVTPNGVRTTSIGADLDARYEVGSVAKAVTGLLMADAIERGEVDPDTRVGSLLPELDDAPAGDATLAELATHRSGLPPQIPSLAQFARNMWANWTGAFPYPATTAQRLDDVRGLDPDTAPETYSNVGFEVLGAALAQATDTAYPDLVAERVLGPVGMDDAHVPVDREELGADDLVGEDLSGRSMAPWVGEAMAPAGGLRADVDDMAALLSAVLEGRAPGLDALEPRADFADDGIGWAWITTEDPEGRDVVWHNGGTGGFGSFLGMDREAEVGVVVLSATGDRVDEAGWALLDEAREAR